MRPCCYGDANGTCCASSHPGERPPRIFHRLLYLIYYYTFPVALLSLLPTALSAPARTIIITINLNHGDRTRWENAFGRE